MFQALIATAFFLSSTAAFAQASLSFSPQRIIMGERDRTATLSLTNRGDAVGTYRIEMSDVVYHDDGSVSQVDETPEGFPSAKPFMRFSPRQVRLQPGETQRVRVLARPPKDIAGEYRVHAILRKLPEAVSLDPDAADKAVTGSVGLIQSVALPIIIRRGTTVAEGGMRNVQRDQDQINVTLWRAGNASLYLDLRAYYGEVDKANEVSVARGIAVPVPNIARNYSLALRDTALGPITVLLIDHYTGNIVDRVTVK